MSKQNRKNLAWILALFFAITNVASIFLPFVGARDILEPAHHMVFHTINITELSIAGAGIAIAPIMYVVLLFCALPIRDKLWLWIFTVVLQEFSFVGAMIDVRIWLSANTTDVEWNIGYALYITSAIFAAASVILAIHKVSNHQEKLSLPTTCIED